MPDFSLIFYGISQLPFSIYLRWSVIIVMSVIFGIALVKQNKYLRIIHEEMQRFKEQDYILKTAQARGLIAFLLWCLFGTFVIFNDINNEVIKMHAYVLDAQSQHQSRTNTIAAAAPALEPQPINTESSLNDIKSIYEDAFVSYMLLNGCQRSNNETYNALYLKLTAALKEFEAPTIQAHNIIIAASGTYDSLYSHTPCEDIYLEPTQKNLDGFLKKQN